jgi:hypothetical protein
VVRLPDLPVEEAAAVAGIGPVADWRRQNVNADLSVIARVRWRHIQTGGSTLYTIKWAGLDPKESGGSPPSDTKQPHAQGCRDPFAFFTSLIAKMHACSAVHLLTFCAVSLFQHRSESTDSFEQFTQIMLR